MLINIEDWDCFSGYIFKESTHEYFYFGEKVNTSVTQFISNFHEHFNKEAVAEKYANKHKLNVQDVIDMWNREGDVASTAGTIIHSKMEQLFNGKVLGDDYNKSIELGVENDTRELVSTLEPIAKDFFNDYRDTIIPIKMEFTVGLGTKLAGNIDLICYNKRTKEIEIWDYKNCKEIKKENGFGKYFYTDFCELEDCNFNKYSIQLNIYKYLLERKIGIKVGKCRLVHFDKTNLNYKIIDCVDLQKEVKEVLEKLEN